MLKYFHTSRRNLVLIKKIIAYLLYVNGSTNQPSNKNTLMLMLCRSAKPHQLITGNLQPTHGKTAHA